MRKSGLRLVGEIDWGQHVAFFYETTEDLVQVGVPFLKAGLDNNEACAWVVCHPLTDHEAWTALGQAIPRLDHARAQGRIELLHSETWYFTGNAPDLKKVEKRWEERLADAVDRGCDGLRVAASAPQLKEHEWAEFFDYEGRLNAFLANKPMLVLCAYPILTPHGGDVRRTHSINIEKERSDD